MNRDQFLDAARGDLWEQVKAQREIVKELSETKEILLVMSETLVSISEALIELKNTMQPGLATNLLMQLKDKLQREYEQLKKENQDRESRG